jgi:hypothetical protein
MKKSLVVLVLILGAHSQAFGQWVQTNGPLGGYVNALAVNGKNLFAGLDDIYLSTDSGMSWNALHTNVPHGFSTIVVNDGDLIIPYGSIYLSSDNGSSWIEKPTGIFQVGFGLLAANGTNFIACTIQDNPGSVIYYSTNSGDSWAASDSGLNNAAVVYLGSCGKNFIAGTDDTYGGIGAYISTDSGHFWFPDTIGLGAQIITSVVMNGTSAFAGTDGGGVFKSTDSGLTWTPSNNGLPNDPHATRLYSFGSMIYTSGSLGGVGIYQSSDEGINWTSVKSDPRIGNDVTSLTSIGPYLFAGTYGAGIFRIGNSDSNWVWTSHGLICSGINSLIEIGNTLLASEPEEYAGSIFRSMDNGNTWNTDTSFAEPIGSLGLYKNNIFAAGYPALRSTDTGVSWSEAEYGLGDDNGAYTFAVHDSTLYAGTEFGIFYWTDSIAAWTKMPGFGDDANAILWNDTTIFAGTESGLFVGSEMGTHWSLATNGIPSRAFFSSLAILNSTIFAGTNYNGMFSSTNNGLSWSRVGTDSQTSATILAASAQNLFVSIGGITYITDGVFWTPIDNGLSISSLALGGQYLFAGVAGAGVWRRPLSDFGISSVSSTPIQESTLTTYPNPLSQSTTIRFTSAESGVARVTVVNLLGEEVAWVFEGALSSGEHSFQWSKPTGLPDGMYECVVQMNGSVQQVPMVVTR